MRLPFDTGATAIHRQQSWRALTTAVCAALISFTALIGLAPPVSAEVIQISGAGLVRHCPCDFDPADSAVITAGVLQSQDPGAHYFAPVVFPQSGVKVCKVSMIYRDVNDLDTMSASLKRKSFSVGGDAFVPPVVMANVESASGVVNTVRRASTKNIKQATVNTSKFFYYLEVNVPTINLELLGIQIVTKNTC